MINNLFSIFDPSTSILSLSWTALLIPPILIIRIKKKLSSKWEINTSILLIPLKKELNALLTPYTHKGINKTMLIVFITLFIINFSALSPFTFTPTAHIIIALPTALSIWLAIIIFGWLNRTKHILAHTVPTGTPNALINFIVLIELTRNIIRPITLSIRLSANMVAGHLLLRLLRNFALSSSQNLILSRPILLILSILEIAVALIQAYVFITLLSLYTTEIH